MNIPVSFKLMTKVDTDIVSKWAEDNDMFDRMTYDWVKRVITFEFEEDAVAFTLAHGIRRHKTKVEEMIENERSINVN
ncbi:MAG TPA: hypothetical protein VIY47_04345 [Ignavibacteriaceae bacterium]